MIKCVIMCGLILTIRFLNADDSLINGGTIVFEFTDKPKERCTNLGLKLMSFEL